MQKDGADVLRALIAAKGGKMLAKDARQKMHLSKRLFSINRVKSPGLSALQALIRSRQKVFCIKRQGMMLVIMRLNV